MGTGRIARLATLLAALATVGVTVAAVPDPDSLLREGAGWNVVIQTTAALAGLLAAVIAFGRFRQRRQAADLFLVVALADVGAGHLLFAVLPLAADGPVSSRTVWAGTISRLAGGLLLAVAAHVRPREVERPERARTDEVATVVVAGVLVVAAYVAAAGLPSLAPGAFDPGRRLWDVAPALAVVAAATALASAVAAAGFLRGAASANPGDELLGWLAASSVVAMGANAITAGTFMSTYSAYVSPADMLRLGCCLLLLGGVVREIRGYWRDRAAAAVVEERRRIARELHDGLAQELAFVVTRTRTLARRGADEDLWTVCSAAERALDESRRAIAALSSTEDEPLDVALAHTADELAGRLGTSVTLELDAAVTVPADTQDALLRIVREAITNAVRHGAATRVHVQLSRNERVRLRVSDNGHGFDPDRVGGNPGRLGLTSIRERAAALGGDVRVSSKRPGGTDVEVLVP